MKTIIRDDGKRYTTSEELKADGFDPKNVNRCCRGQRKSHKGHTWSYEEPKAIGKKADLIIMDDPLENGNDRIKGMAEKFFNTDVNGSKVLHYEKEPVSIEDINENISITRTVDVSAIRDELVKELREKGWKSVEDIRGMKTIEELRQALKRFGLSVNNGLGGILLIEDANLDSPLKPGWIDLKEFAKRHKKNYSYLRRKEVVKSAPESIARLIGNGWLVKEEYFKHYVNSLYKTR